MTDLKKLPDDEKMSHLRNLISLAMKDGEIARDELAVLQFCAEKYDLPFSQVESILLDPDGVEFVVPKGEDACFHQLFDMTEMMIIDGVVHKRERDLCEALALRLGYQAEAVNEIIQGILEANRKSLSDEDMEAHVRARVEAFKA